VDLFCVKNDDTVQKWAFRQDENHARYY
jgi:hypothetical protein